MKRLLLALFAVFALSTEAYATGAGRLRLGFIPPASALPANQTLNIGTKTFAGYGGCNSSNSGGSVPFLNITYTGTHASSLVFSQAVPGKISTDTRLKIDSHNCVVPNGTYGGTPTLAVTTATYVITDTFGATGNLNVVAVPNRFDVTNIDPGDGSNVDTASCTAGSACGTMVTQFRLVLEKTPASGGPVMGDSVYLRCGAIIDPPVWDRVTSANAATGVVTPGDLRVTRPLDSAMTNAYANGGYTIFTLPDADKITITDESPGCATIRHIRLSGATQTVQGFKFLNLNHQRDFNGTNGFATSDSILTIGPGGSVAQSFVEVASSTFQSNSGIVGQRGQQGIYTTSVGVGSTGCTTATVAYHDNGAGPNNGFGATATATIDQHVGAGNPGVITGWGQSTNGSGYSLQGTPATTATVTSDCTGSTPTATPHLNGMDLVSGISALGPNKELYIHDNIFTDMFDGVNLTGNLTASDNSATDFWIIGNTFERPWIAGIQTTAAGPVYADWNFTKNIKYASGYWHPDCEIDLYSTLGAGVTYQFGERIGNICVRATGLTTTTPDGAWADSQGWFMSNPVNGGVANGSISATTVTFTANPGVLAVNNTITGLGVTAGTVIMGGISQWNGTNASATVNHSQVIGPIALTVGNPNIMTGCLFEGNIYVGTFANGITLASCDSTAVVAFNTLVQDPVSGIKNLNQQGVAASSSASIISKYSGSANFNGLSAYNAVAGNFSVWTGGSPTDLCNVKSIGVGLGTNKYAATSLDFTTLTTVLAVQMAFQPKAAGDLTPTVQTTCNAGGAALYNAGTGGYFDYVNRVSTAPF
jgi:hypothetical protein